MDPRSRSASVRRRRKTIHFDAPTLLALIDDAVDQHPLLAGVGLPGDVRGEEVRQHLLALLKAFCDAARPAGGLPLNELAEPRDLPGIVARGQANARAGECQPKLLEKVRAGRPVDLRIAIAALHFFRHVLARPALQLSEIGGLEVDRLRAVHRIERGLTAARQDLPASVYEALRRRAEETASYAAIMVDTRVHYGALREETDARGVRRLVLQRTTFQTPARLLSFEGRLSPFKAYEWYQWNQIRHARLLVRIHRGPAGGTETIEPPLRRRLLHDEGIFRIEIAPDTSPSILQRLVTPAVDAPGVVHEIVWEEELVFNVADRDILAWYSPVHGLAVDIDPTVARRLHVAVGDSPGLVSTPTGWRLDRTLMPREVIAVRLRLRSLSPEQAPALGAAGECYDEVTLASPP